MSDKRTTVIAYDVFLRELRQLRKSFGHIDRDLELLIDPLERGETPGDRLQQLAPCTVYKVRLANRDAQRGKSGGYRVLYYVQTEVEIVLLAIYSKSVQADIANETVRSVFKPSLPRWKATTATMTVTLNSPLRTCFYAPKAEALRRVFAKRRF